MKKVVEVEAEAEVATKSPLPVTLVGKEEERTFTRKEGGRRANGRKDDGS